MNNQEYLDNEVRRICHYPWFREHIQNIVQNEVSRKLFWSHLFEDARLDNHVRMLAKDCVPGHVKRYLNENIAKVMMSQLPPFLEQNKQVDNILSKHTQALELKLEAKSDEILSRIVRDPKYHVINRGYFDAIQEDAERTIRNAREQISRENRELRSKLEQCDSLQSQVTTMKYTQIGIATSCLVGFGIAGFTWLKS